MNMITPVAATTNLESLESAADFLTDIVGSDGSIAIARIHPNGGRPVGETFSLPTERAALLDCLARHNGSENLYFTLNGPKPKDQQIGKNGRLVEEDIAILRGIAVDLDPVEDAETTEGGYERERRRLLGVADEWAGRFLGAPTAIIDSGNGVQMIWLFSEPMPNTAENKTSVKAQAKGLKHLFGPGADAVQSVEHLFRIPFTENLPNKTKQAKGRSRCASRLRHSNLGETYSLASLSMIARPDFASSATKSVELVDFDYDTVLEAAETPDTLSRHLAAVAEEIKEGPGASELFNNPKRHQREFGLAMRCLELGISDATEIGQLVFSLSPHKLLEKDEEGYGLDYAERTIKAALGRFAQKPSFDVIEEDDALPQAEATPLTSEPPTFRAPLLVDFPIKATAIPRRQWLAYPAIPQGEAMLLVGPPKAAKSAWTNSLALTVLCGDPAPLFGTSAMPPWRFKQGRVLMVNNEDPTDEILRRVSAAAKAAGIRPPSGHLMVMSGADADSSRYTVLRRIKGGSIERACGYNHLAKIINDFQPDLVVFDSLVSMAEGLSENDNSEMDRLARTLRGLAAQSGATALIVHHTSKGKVDAAGDATAARGAFSLYGAVRGGLTLLPLSDDGREQAGLPPGRYIRLDDSGGNYSAKDERAHIWRIERGEVGNGTEGTSPPANAAVFFDDADEFTGRRGDTAPVIQYVGAFRIKGKKFAKMAGETTKDDNSRAAAVAREIKAVLGEVTDTRFDRAFKEKLTVRLRGAGLMAGASASSVEKLLREAIPHEGLEISNEGQPILVYRRAANSAAKAPIHIGWKPVRSFGSKDLSEAQRCENA